MPSTAAEHYQRTAPPDAGRIDAWLAGTLPLTRSRIQHLIRDGQITVDGHPVRPSTRLLGGEQVHIQVPPPPPSDLLPQDIPVPILFIDAHLVVVDKPAGMVVHPAKGHPDGTLVNALLHLLRGHDTTAAGEPVRPGLVHRIDRGTSGILVVARTPEALAHLAAQFAEHSVDRRYAALVWGEPPTRSGTIDAPLGRHPRDRKRFAVVEGGKRAVTHWWLRGTATVPADKGSATRQVSLIECRLETGRTHQVRVHMAHIGLPLLGDPSYGRPRARLPAAFPAIEGPYQLLHAWRLAFTHPVTGERMRFHTPPRPDFAALLTALAMPDPVHEDA